MTTLEKLRAQKSTLEALMEESALSPDQLWLFQELNYRIEVFECCQMFHRSAPCTADTQVLCRHYKLVDAYIHHLSLERQYGKPADETQKQHRAAALGSLNQVIADYRRRFQSYRPGAAEQYAADIGKVLCNVLTVWMQHRDCYIDIKKQEVQAE